MTCVADPKASRSGEYAVDNAHEPACEECLAWHLHAFTGNVPMYTVQGWKHTYEHGEDVLEVPQEHIRLPRLARITDRPLRVRATADGTSSR